MNEEYTDYNHILNVNHVSIYIEFSLNCTLNSIDMDQSTERETNTGQLFLFNIFMYICDAIGIIYVHNEKLNPEKR